MHQRIMATFVPWKRLPITGIPSSKSLQGLSPLLFAILLHSSYLACSLGSSTLEAAQVSMRFNDEFLQQLALKLSHINQRWHSMFGIFRKKYAGFLGALSRPCYTIRQMELTRGSIKFVLNCSGFDMLGDPLLWRTIYSCGRSASAFLGVMLKEHSQHGSIGLLSFNQINCIVSSAVFSILPWDPMSLHLYKSSLKSTLQRFPSTRGLKVGAMAVHHRSLNENFEYCVGDRGADRFKSWDILGDHAFDGEGKNFLKRDVSSLRFLFKNRNLP